MSSVSESITEHITIGDIRRRYGISTIGTHRDAVTLTSVADALEDITPGALYISSTSQYDPRIVHAAAKRGAYAVVFMAPDKSRIGQDTDDSDAEATSDVIDVPIDPEIPVLFADLHNDTRARIAADMTAMPSASLAVFAVQGDNAPLVMAELYHLLHYLGNPLGIIDTRGGVSLERELGLKTPLSPLDIQKMLYIMLEDGATSVIIQVDDSVLEALALTSVKVDVYTNTSRETFNVPELETQSMETQRLTQRTFLNRRANRNDAEELRRLARQDVQAYGADISNQTLCVEVTEEAMALVREIIGEKNTEHFNELAMAVSMVLAAGVKRNSIKSALGLSHELKADNR
ncbi:hypothetical protein [Alloscardovia criceti]|uniref:hypothetical protein n=1 Tax=Alloscardovia criceti TaxID=356828 RepID=UPI000363DC3C|nr:hypothetical protein [Alloscardovia criceti]